MEFELEPHGLEAQRMYELRQHTAERIIKEDLRNGPQPAELVALHLIEAVKGDDIILDAAVAAGVVRLKDSDNKIWWALPKPAKA